MSKLFSLQTLGRCALSAALLCILVSLSGCQVVHGGVLYPKGLIAYQERQLLFDSIALMMIVVIPVIIMSIAFVVRYRASHKTADYKPNWSHSVLLESIWWGVPCVIIVVLGIMTWRSSHQLDPYRKLNIPGKPLVVEAIALPWKWVFIYPEQNIATVNKLVIPVGRQISFRLTSDNVPMSAFFIPQLGSQIYTMAGMRTRLHLIANHTGTFEGLNSQYNGAGFSDMHFVVNVVSASDMKTWVQTAKRAAKPLSEAAYEKLLKPSMKDPAQIFSSVKSDLFKNTMKTYKVTGEKGHPRRNFTF